MPFTPFHLGPALAVGLPLRNRFHLPTFIVGSVILDIEPLAVLVLGLMYPLHGYLHTFMGAIGVGLLLGYAMYVLEGLLKPLWRKLVLVPTASFKPKRFLVAGLTGTVLHVLMDSPLYYDIKPLYPIPVNPFYNPGLAGPVYGVCIVTGLIGLTYYSYIILRALISRRK